MFSCATYCFHVIKDRVESKHLPIHLSFSIPYAKKELPRDRVSQITKLEWNNEKILEFLSLFTSESSLCSLEYVWNTIDNCVETAITAFTDTILQAADCMRKTVTLHSSYQVTNSKRWYDRECADKKRSAQKASSKFHRTDKTGDNLDYIIKRNDYSNTVRGKNRIYKQNMKSKLLKEKNNCTKFWSLSKEVRCQNKKNPNIELETWKKHFETLHNEGFANADTVDNNHAFINVTVPELDDPITESEVKDALNNLKNGKSSGLDEICSEFFKCTADIISPIMGKIFNKLYNACYFPVNWSKSIIVPVFKKGDAEITDNYRGISLLCILSKAFTFILNKRMYTWAEKEDKLSPEQGGFRKSFSTIDHIFTLTTIVQSKFNCPSGGKVYACFVDYHKAFDKVDRDKLWDKLRRLQMSSKIIAMLQAIYSRVVACVRWDGKLSDFFTCPIGLKQGCLMSPLLFSLLITDVADYIRQHGRHGFQIIPGGPELFSLLFADDIVLLSSTPHGLQTQINSLQTASKSIGLTVNTSKTKVMVFRKGGYLGRREKWTLGGEPLEVVNSYKYLGYMFTTQLSDNIACEDFAGKAKGKTLDILKTMYNIGSMNTVIFFKFFDAQIKPMLLYASEVWGISKVCNIESAHLFALKRLLSVSDKSPNTMIYGETGRYPLYIDSALSSVKYWLKVLKMSDTRYPKQCLIYMTEAMNRNRHFYTPYWTQKIRDCLVKYGFDQVWLNQGTPNEALFLKELKARMIETFIEEWNVKLHESDRFSLYSSFKNIFRCEAYLNDITIKRFRDVLIQFRLGINDLGINKRFDNDDIICKSCPFCPGTYEDETHVIFICPKYNELRSKYLDFMFQERNYSVVNVLSVISIESMRNVGMFLFYCMQLRNER